MRRCTPCWEFALLANDTNEREMYEKTAFTSIGSNRTGSVAGKTS
jgi:hypothetical protein